MPTSAGIELLSRDCPAEFVDHARNYQAQERERHLRPKTNGSSPRLCRGRTSSSTFTEVTVGVEADRAGLPSVGLFMPL